MLLSHVPLALPCSFYRPSRPPCTTTTAGITGADLLASVCHRYSTVKKLVVKPTSSTERTAADPRFGAALLVEICFAGPQPSESCGELLCLLLGGDSVQAWPVELPRGRKRKNTIMSITGKNQLLLHNCLLRSTLL